MSKEMNLPIIVEGVETEKQAEFLKKMNVRYAQGYLFYRPMAVEDFTQLLTDKNKVDHRGIYYSKMDSHHFNKLVESLLEEKRRQEKRCPSQGTLSIDGRRTRQLSCCLRWLSGKAQRTS